MPSNAGGGGERVLWGAIAYLQRTEPNVVSAIYTGDTDASKSDIIAKVKASPGYVRINSFKALQYSPGEIRHRTRPLLPRIRLPPIQIPCR